MSCRACPRLVAWREEVAATRRAAFRDEEYWARPVPGFGDPEASIAVVGPGPRRPRREPHGAGVHRRPLRRLAVSPRSIGPGLANQPTSVRRRRRSAPARRVGDRLGALRAARQPADSSRAGSLPSLPGAGAGPAGLGAGRRGPGPVRLRRGGPGPRARPAAPLRPRRRGRGSGRPNGDLLVPPQPAEHLHRQADRAHAGRRVRAGRGSSAQGS